MRAAGRMVHFPASDDTVTATLHFSQCQYAQLLQQRFALPRGQPMPSASLQPAERRAAELGLKVTAGFEILWARAARVGRLPCETDEAACAPADGDVPPATGAAAASSELPSHRAVLTEQQLQSLPAWLAYKASLEGSGYFEGNIAGSARWGLIQRVSQGPLH
jgi:hypothetical protein